MARKYNYFKAVCEDVEQYIEENINFEDYNDRDDLEQQLNDDLWTEDSVTGNGSGSYTFDGYKAEEYICHNLDLLVEAAEEFGSNLGQLIKEGAESCDVTIRCYLLSSAISKVLDKLDSKVYYATDIPLF